MIIYKIDKEHKQNLATKRENFLKQIRAFEKQEKRTTERLRKNLDKQLRQELMGVIQQEKAKVNEPNFKFHHKINFLYIKKLKARYNYEIDNQLLQDAQIKEKVKEMRNLDKENYRKYLQKRQVQHKEEFKSIFIFIDYFLSFLTVNFI